MFNRRISKSYMFIMVFLIIMFSILVFDNLINEVIGTIGLIASVLIVIYQLSCDNDITMGTFILELNNSFIGNERILAIYHRLKSFEDMTDEEKEHCITEEDRPNLDEYLVFFETISVLRKKGIIEMSTLDEMFGYRFFIAMNNPLVQKIELEATGFENYVALIELYKEWRQYRIRKYGKDAIPGEKSSSFYLLIENV